MQDAEYEQERRWLLDHLEETKNGSIAGPSSSNNDVAEEEEDEECEDGIECGCCFAKYAFVRVIAFFPEFYLFWCRTKWFSVLKPIFSVAAAAG